MWGPLGKESEGLYVESDEAVGRLAVLIPNGHAEAKITLFLKEPREGSIQSASKLSRKTQISPLIRLSPHNGAELHADLRACHEDVAIDVGSDG